MLRRLVWTAMLSVVGLSAQKLDEVDVAVLRWNETAVRYQEVARFQEAGEAYRRALELAAGAPIAPESRLLLTLNYASLFLEEGSYREAEALMKKAREIARKVDPASQEIAAMDNYACLLYLLQSRLTQARTECEKALSILDRPGAPQKDALASALQNLAAIQMRTGQFKQARANSDRSLAILERMPEPHISQLIRLLISLSSLQYVTQDLAGAERNIRRALDLGERHYGPDHPMMANAMENYALILQRLHRGKEARIYRRRAQALLAKSRPPAGTHVVDVQELSSSAMPGPVLVK